MLAVYEYKVSLSYVREKRTYNLLEQLSKDSDKFVVYQLTTFQARIFESFDLLLDNDLEGLGTNKQ